MGTGMSKISTLSIPGLILIWGDEIAHCGDVPQLRKNLLDPLFMRVKKPMGIKYISYLQERIIFAIYSISINDVYILNPPTPRNILESKMPCRKAYLMPALIQVLVNVQTTESLDNWRRYFKIFNRKIKPSLETPSPTLILVCESNARAIQMQNFVAKVFGKLQEDYNTPMPNVRYTTNFSSKHQLQFLDQVHVWIVTARALQAEYYRAQEIGESKVSLPVNLRRLNYLIIDDCSKINTYANVKILVDIFMEQEHGITQDCKCIFSGSVWDMSVMSSVQQTLVAAGRKRVYIASLMVYKQGTATLPIKVLNNTWTFEALQKATNMLGVGPTPPASPQKMNSQARFKSISFPKKVALTSLVVFIACGLMFSKIKVFVKGWF